jgi:hypothetical protein
LSAICPPGPRRLRLGMRTVGLGAIGVVLAVACGQPHPTPKASASATPSAGAWASLPAWRACGSDVVPPANVLATPKLPVKVDASRTNGAVSQREADRWAAAFLREQAIENWAVTTSRKGLLAGGCLGSSQAYENLFGGEVANMDQARAVGGHIELDPPATLNLLALVPTPAAARQYADSLSGEEPQYAIVATAQGPLAVYIVDSSGKRHLHGPLTPAGVVFRQAYFGQYRTGSIGPLWFGLAFGACGSAWMAGTCEL